MKTFLISISLFLFYSGYGQDTLEVNVAAINNDMLILGNSKDIESFEKYQKILIVQLEGKSALRPGADSTGKANAQKEIPRKYIVVTITDVQFSDDTNGMITAVKISRNLQNSFFINNNARVRILRVYSSWTW